MNKSSDDCSELPDIPNLKTTSQFPVPYNTRVTVLCDAGYSLKNGDVITCIRGDEYQSIHGQLPSCQKSELMVYKEKNMVLFMVQLSVNDFYFRTLRY